jgi:hypothetical protein
LVVWLLAFGFFTNFNLARIFLWACGLVGLRCGTGLGFCLAIYLCTHPVTQHKLLEGQGRPNVMCLDVMTVAAGPHPASILYVFAAVGGPAQPTDSEAPVLSSLGVAAFDCGQCLEKLGFFRPRILVGDWDG